MGPVAEEVPSPAGGYFYSGPIDPEATVATAIPAIRVIRAYAIGLTCPAEMWHQLAGMTTGAAFAMLDSLPEEIRASLLGCFADRPHSRCSSRPTTPSTQRWSGGA